MLTLRHIGPPPPRCGGLSPRPPCRVGLDRTSLACRGGLSRPPPRVGLGRTPSPRHVELGCSRLARPRCIGMVCSRLAPPQCVGLGRYHPRRRRRVGLGCTRPPFPPHRVRMVVVVFEVVCGWYRSPSSLLR